MKEHKYEVLLASVIAARATSFIFSKMILEYIDTFNLLAIRCLLAFAILAVLFFIYFTAAVFLVKRNILCEWKTVLLTGAVAWTPMLLTDDML